MVIDAEMLIRIIGSIGPIVITTATKLVIDSLNGRASKMRDEYKFSKEFLEAVEKKDDIQPIHPFAVEKGYQALAGSTKVKADEVHYILGLKDASVRLREFVEGYEYVQLTDSSDGKKISFRPKYGARHKLKLRRLVYFGLYFSIFFAALSPFAFKEELHLTLPMVGLALLITVPTLVPFAIHFLIMQFNIASAQKLVDSQCKRDSQTAR